MRQSWKELWELNKLSVKWGSQTLERLHTCIDNLLWYRLYSWHRWI